MSLKLRKAVRWIPGVGNWRWTRTTLIFTALVASIATVGSLYLSLGLGLIPCELCWYQRILMYPLVVVLGVGAYENRPEVYRTALPFSTLGTVIAAYHSYIQRTPSGTSCQIGSTVNCATIQYKVWFLSVPNLSLIAFILITGGVSLVYVKNR